VEILRTPEARFASLDDYPFEPHYLEWKGLRIHYVDSGPGSAGVALLLHGEPTWSYLYRTMIPPLAAAGFRCIAPDHLGFGRSDKPADDGWYVIERHCEALRFLIGALDLRRVLLVVQDWGGPIGLRQAVDQPARFERLVILNTWLHHEGFVYSDGIRRWREAATDPARLGGDMPCGRIVAGSLQRPGHDKARVARAYDAPFPDASFKAGARRFPWCIPFAELVDGNAADQARCYEALARWRGPVHVMFGDADPVFPAEWGARWSRVIPGASFERIEGAGHFVQEEAGGELAERILAHVRAARTAPRGR
jgi:haloalkane dehalogenase